jgi:hypothetical protein
VKKLRVRRPSAATSIALLALFVALGGTGYAASQLPSNSVGSAQIKRGAVHRSDLHKNAVTSKKVKNGSLLAADFKSGQLPRGPKGDPGVNGTNGTNGRDGAPGTARAYAFVDSVGNLNSAKSKNIVAVTHPGTGQYCVQLDPSIDASTVEAVATTDYSTAPVATLAYIRSSGFDCTGTTNTIDVHMTQVVTTTSTNPASEAATNAGFFMIVP